MGEGGVIGGRSGAVELGKRRMLREEELEKRKDVEEGGIGEEEGC